MRKFNVLTIVFLFIVNCSCDKKLEKEEKSTISQTKNIDSLVFIKDTTVFSNSSEGEKLSLFKDKRTNDSVIKSTVYGEMGKVDFAFVFNKKILSANRLIFNYEKPIYVSSTPKINKKTEENLNTSSLIKDELTNVFFQNVKFFRNQNLSETSNEIDLILKKWEGIYYLSPYSIDSDELGSYYIEVFKSNANFGFSGNNDFQIKIGIIEKGNKLYVYDKKNFNKQVNVEDALVIITKIKNKNYVKSKIIKILRNDVKQNRFGYLFNWKKKVEEVPDTRE